jgi:type II secretory pathway component PulJ
MLSLRADRLRRPGRGTQRGASLVELLVGVAVGLFIVAGATMTVSTQLSENKRLLAETQMQQDLRAAADIMTRELRRSGYWLDAHLGVALANRDAQPNPLSGITATAGANAQATYRYRRAVNQEGPYGFRLFNGVLQMQVDGGTWQDLTDSRIMQVTAFGVQGFAEPSEVLPCPKACADGTTDCWPRHQTRGFVLSLDARSRTDAEVTRSLVTTVRLRNDLVEFRAPGAPTQACPT